MNRHEDFLCGQLAMSHSHSYSAGMPSLVCASGWCLFHQTLSLHLVQYVATRLVPVKA